MAWRQEQAYDFGANHVFCRNRGKTVKIRGLFIFQFAGIVVKIPPVNRSPIMLNCEKS